MKLEHIHLNEVESTQIYLKNLVDSKKLPSLMTLVSTERRTSGIGRSNNSWQHLKNSLAFSFTLQPNEKIELTPIECAIILKDFIKAEYDIEIYFKWPNDLLNKKGEKIGGIISHFVDGICIIGIGLNFFCPKEKKDFEYGNLFETKIEPIDTKNLTALLYLYFIANRFTPDEIYPLFSHNCFHMNKKVEIIEDNKTFKGTFIGIDESGAALVLEDKSGEQKKIYSATLRIC